MSWSLIVNVIKILIKLSSYTNGSTLILDHYSILANIVQQCLCNQHHVPNNLNSSFIYLPSALKASPTRSPLILRQYILLLFAQLGEIGATEWLAVGSLLSGKPQFEKDRKFTSIREALSEIDFSVWLTEFEGILYERSKIWNKTNTKAADVFNTLADGTYRWQTIVQSRVETTPEYEVVQLLQTHFNLLMSLHRSAPCKNEIERYEFNNYLIEKTRLNAIFEKLKLCDCPSIKEIHSRYKSYLAELKGSMVIPMTVVGDPSHGLNSKQLRRRPNISLRENSSTTPTELF
ncbi:hypothetical protein BDR26DRAFT_865995 [Obelidium mucronatum]|nr:hypothetical protein BDR26DRAFT_865995 [Obelidium mucronatum]